MFDHVRKTSAGEDCVAGATVSPAAKLGSRRVGIALASSRQRGLQRPAVASAQGLRWQGLSAQGLSEQASTGLSSIGSPRVFPPASLKKLQVQKMVRPPRMLYAVPRPRHVHAEIAEAIVSLCAPGEAGGGASITGAAGLADLDRLAADFLREIEFRRASPDDPKHPGWPAGTPGGKGGQFRPKDGATAPSAPTPSFDPTQNQRSQLGPPPEIPKEPPPTARLRNAMPRAVARWLARAAIETAVGGPIGDLMALAEAAYWIYRYRAYLLSYADPPKPLEELQRNALSPRDGYDIHHIVEQGAARSDGFPEWMINAPDNLVIVPTYKHWQITSWFMTPNWELDWRSPREYLRGRDWEQRVKIGKKALVLFGVLKP